MRKYQIFAVCFSFVFVFSFALVLFMTEPAKAIYCDEYAPGPFNCETDFPCTTPSGRSGTWVDLCEGWIHIGPETYCCGCIHIYCKVPPRPPDELPYQEP